MESRSPSQSSMEYEPDEPLEEGESKFTYQFCITNIPEHWSRKLTKNFIIETVNSKHVSQNLNVYRKQYPNKPRVNVLMFSDKEAAEEAYEILKGVMIDGKKLFPTMMNVQNQAPLPMYYPNSDMHISKPLPKTSKQWNTAPAFFQGDFTNETFGLSVQFLEQLGIEPPLPPSIFVSNLPLNIDEKELKDIFSFAGKVVKIIFMKHPDGTSKCKAIIVFDHPLEAVQAISMFNNQSLHGNNLFICKDTKSHSAAKILPAGLLSIGPGLGENGNAIHNVRINMEIEEIKRLIRDWLNNANNTNQNLNTNKQTNGLNNNIQENRPSDLFQTLSHNLNPNPAANTNFQALLQGLIQQAHSVNAAQNTLQSIVNLMSNMGSRSTNQTLPVPANQTQQDNSTNALSTAQNNLQSVLTLMSNMGSQSTNQILPVPPNQQQQNISVNSLDTAQNPSQGVLPFMSKMGNQATNQTLPVPVKQPVHSQKPQFPATFTQMTNVTPVRHTTPNKPNTLANNNNIPTLWNGFGMMNERDATQVQRQKRCYTCRQFGHEAKECRMKRRCAVCKNNNHKTEACWFANRAGSTR